MPFTVAYCFHALFQYLSTFDAVCAGAGTALPVLTICCRRPGCGIRAMSGAVPPWTRTGSCASKSLLPSYAILMPVQLLNSAHDFCSESDSGVWIDAYIETVLPECPANAWYFAQSPVRLGPGLVDVLDLLEQAASTVSAATAGAITLIVRRKVVLVIGDPLVRVRSHPSGDDRTSSGGVTEQPWLHRVSLLSLSDPLGRM